MTDFFDFSTMMGGTIFTLEGVNDIFVAKYDSTGTILSAKCAGGTGNDAGIGIAVDTGKNVWIACSIPASTGYLINFNSDTLAEPSGCTDPLILTEYNSSGTYVNSIILPSGGDDNVGIAFDGNNNFYLCSDFETSMIFGCDTLPNPTPDIEAFFVAKYNINETPTCHRLSTQTPSSEQDLNLSPNPATTTLTIQTTPQIQTLSIINYLGQTLITQNITGTEKTELNIAYLPTGMYLLEAIDDKRGRIIRKFIKQ